MCAIVHMWQVADTCVPDLGQLLCNKISRFCCIFREDESTVDAQMDVSKRESHMEKMEQPGDKALDETL